MTTAHPGEQGNGDQRVTNALIAHKIDALTVLMKDHIAHDERIWEAHEARIRSLEQGQIKRQTQIETINGEVEKLRAESKAWNIINSIGVAIAGIFAGLGWGK